MTDFSATTARTSVKKVANKPFTIDLKQQMTIRNESKQLGTTNIYEKRLSKFICYLNNAGYSLDAISSHHPILIADYLRLIAVKEKSTTVTDKIVYFSESHWYNTWSALADYYNSCLVAGWPKIYEPKDLESLVDIFETPKVFLDLNMPSNPLHSNHVLKVRKSIVKKINLNCERSKSSDVLLPSDLLHFYTFNFSNTKHSEGLLFYSYLLLSFGIKLCSRFSELADLKWKDISFGKFANPDNPEQITRFITVYLRNRKTDYSKKGVMRKIYPSYGSQESPYCAFQFFQKWYKMVERIQGGTIYPESYVFSNFSARNVEGIVDFIFNYVNKA